MPDNQYPDNPSIKDTDQILRRIHPSHWIRDSNLGKIRPTSQAFKDSSDGTPMSINLNNLLKSPEEAIEGYPGHLLVSFTAGFARHTLNQRVGPEPLPEDPSHGYVAGDKGKSNREKFANSADWVIKPAEAM
jgi:hypothetical protein